MALFDYTATCDSILSITLWCSIFGVFYCIPYSWNMITAIFVIATDRKLTCSVCMARYVEI